ncbi:MAG: hypothetical protein VKO39_01640 [Cyanobacteriota bacterium]|nr:hypothetical protein [Cyanobacteriota bacterium]
MTFSNPFGVNYSINTTFNPALTTTGQAEFRYTLTHNLGYSWIQAGLTSNMLAGNPGGVFSKEVCSSGFGTGTCTTFSTTDTSTDPPGGLLGPLVGYGNMIYVRDTYQTTVATGLITNFTNSYVATPGPLPLLGMGVGFGFSRRLRSRIKTSRQS